MGIEVVAKPVFINLDGEFPHCPPKSKPDALNYVNTRLEELRRDLPDYTKLLEPLLVEKSGDLANLYKELSTIDLLIVYRVGGNARKILPTFTSLNKPILFYKAGMLGIDCSAYFRSRGLLAYNVLDKRELKSVVGVIRTLKALAQTKALALVSRLHPPYSHSVLGNVENLKALKDKFGIDVILIPLAEVFKVEVDDGELKKLMDDIITSSIEISIPEESVKRGLKLYLAIKRFLSIYNANAFTIDCFDPILYKQAVTPCLSLILSNSEGVPASCEADLNALVSIIILRYLSDKPCFMGNLWIQNLEKNLVRISHDIPPLNFDYISGPRKPYKLMDFHGNKRCVTAYVDIAEGTEVTLARVSPDLRRLMSIKGVVKACYEGIACRETLEIEVSDAAKVRRFEDYYGNHFALVLGDYIEEIEKLCEALGLNLDLI